MKPSSKGYSLHNEVNRLESQGNYIYLKLIRVTAWETTNPSSLKKYTKRFGQMVAVPIVSNHGNDITFESGITIVAVWKWVSFKKGMGPILVLTYFGGRGPLYRRSAEVNNVSEVVPPVKQCFRGSFMGGFACSSLQIRSDWNTSNSILSVNIFISFPSQEETTSWAPTVCQNR